MKTRPHQFNIQQVVDIPTGGNNCPVYCVAEYLISELIKDPKYCELRDRDAVVGLLTDAFNKHLKLNLKSADLVSLLKQFDDAHPVAALETVSDVLLATCLKDLPRDEHNMLDDRVFEKLGEYFGVTIILYNNPRGVSTIDSGLQEAKNNEITLGLKSIYSPQANSRALLEIYHLADEGSAACGLYLKQEKPTVEQLPQGSDHAYFLVQDGLQQPTALYFVDRKANPAVSKLTINSNALSNIKSTLSSSGSPINADLAVLNSGQLQHITALTRHTLAKHLHYNLLLDVENVERVKKFNDSLKTLGGNLADTSAERQPQLVFRCAMGIANERVQVAQNLSNKIATLLRPPAELKSDAVKRQTLLGMVEEQVKQLEELEKLQEIIKNETDKIAGSIPIIPEEQAAIELLIETIKRQQKEWATIKSTLPPEISPISLIGGTESTLPLGSRRGSTFTDPRRVASSGLFSLPLNPPNISRYRLFNADEKTIDKLLKQIEPALTPAPSGVASSPMLTTGNFRVGEHSFADDLIKDDSILGEIKKFTVVESNKTFSSLDSKLVFEEKALAAMQQSGEFKDLNSENQEILLAIVHKQIADGIAALQAANKSISITLSAGMTSLMRDVYISYCSQMGYTLRDKADENKIIVTGKEKVQLTKESRAAFQAKLSQMLEKAPHSPLSFEPH